MDWNNVDLSDGSHERDANLMDPLTFEQLLLEINCNLKDITPDTVQTLGYARLADMYEEAKDIFWSNLDNIVEQARKERNRP